MIDKITSQNILDLKISYYYGGHTKLTEYWDYKNLNTIYSKCYFVLDGRLKIKTKTEEIIGTPNTLIILPAGFVHDECCPFPDKATKYWMHFSLEVAGKSIFDLIPIPISIHVSDTAYVKSLFEKIFECSRQRNVSSLMHQQSYLFALIAYYFQEANVSLLINEQNTNATIFRIASYIQENIADPPSVEELANLCHFNTSYFIRIFKKTLGCTPHQYIRRLQIEMAKGLLENSKHSIAYIASAVGFSDVKHFSKTFKQHTRVTPTTYRENIKINYVSQ